MAIRIDDDGPRHIEFDGAVPCRAVESRLALPFSRARLSRRWRHRHGFEARSRCGNSAGCSQPANTPCPAFMHPALPSSSSSSYTSDTGRGCWCAVVWCVVDGTHTISALLGNSHVRGGESDYLPATPAHTYYHTVDCLCKHRYGDSGQVTRW